jgi:hypothetical protein
MKFILIPTNPDQSKEGQLESQKTTKVITI